MAEGHGNGPELRETALAGSSGEAAGQLTSVVIYPDTPPLWRAGPKDR